MYDKDKFKEKFDTDRTQRNDESILDKISDEDKELYTELEILTGLSPAGRLNKYFQNGCNKGKKYETVRGRAMTSFKKYMDKKISEEEIDELWEKIWKSSKRGSFNFTKLLMDRLMGKEEENINVKIDDISFKMDPNKVIRKKKEDE